MSLPPSVIERVRQICGDHGVRFARDVPMARHTSAGVGGPVACLTGLPEGESAARFVADLAGLGVELRALGNGTNLLVEDAGGPWVVVRLGGFSREVRIEGTRVVSPAGVSLPWLARHTAKRGLRGLEHAEGIPGTVGGSTAGNAGCYGAAMGDVVRRLRLLHGGEVQEREVDATDFDYREGPLKPGEILLEVEMDLREDDPEAIRSDSARWREQRLASQPVGQRSAGCVFRNPEGESAGRLIDAAGLKGVREGGARVSEIHANFLVNDGSATAADFLRLIERIREEVRARFEAELVPEIELWRSEGRAA